jgi:AI-2 transport protein TqsA
MIIALSFSPSTTGQMLLLAGTDIAAKLQKYMLVRSVVSILTGVVVWSFALVAGIELATAWGVIAFVLNYIPFIGSLFATIFPTVFALVQFESWQLAIAVFACLNLIQFLIGSYFEPRMAGAALSISPLLCCSRCSSGASFGELPGPSLVCRSS